MTGICIVCVDDESTGNMVTCRNCRANMHQWEKRRPAEILERSRKLRKYQRRMQQFAVVKDDDVTLVDHETLQKKRVMMFKDVKRRAKSNVVQLKVMERRRHTSSGHHHKERQHA
ncbi:MAG TPA: hypothetical protein VGQ52_13820 [Gemmatimonadaceae bacterium]|jgi:hypothetical protein|nr:hypothetical protein [Gemmatimonadaceae bacterium]